MRLPRPVQRRLYNLVVQRRQVYLPSAPYRDGWVSRRTVHYVRLGDDGWVTVFGNSPHWPFRKPLTIQVVLEREILVKTVRERGAFQIHVRARGRRLVPVALELVANASYVPKRSGLGDDDRSVAFQVEKILPGRQVELIP